MTVGRSSVVALLLCDLGRLLVAEVLWHLLALLRRVVGARLARGGNAVGHQLLGLHVVANLTGHRCATHCVHVLLDLKRKKIKLEPRY